MNLRNSTAAGSCCCLLMHLKVLIFRGNAPVYIKGPYIFLLAYFFTRALLSLSSSNPQVHFSRAEELHRPVSDRASPAFGPARATHQEPVDQGVEKLAGRWDGQTLQALHPAVAYTGHSCGRRLLFLSSSRYLRWHDE